MFFWQRREVLNTLSNDTFVKARNSLSNHNIPYDIKVTSLINKAGQGRMPTSGINWDASNLYYIYVKKADVKKANYVIENSNRSLNS